MLSMETSSHARRAIQHDRRHDGAASKNVRSEERVASVLAGGAALGWGLSSRSWLGAAGAVMGGGLLYRGVTGHCHMYQALGLSTRKPQLADGAVEVIRAVTIQAPALAIYDAWKNPDVMTRVMHHFAEVRRSERGSLRWTIHDPLGRAHSWDTRIIEDQAGRRLSFGSASDAPVTHRCTLSIEDAPGDRGSEAQLQLEFVPHGLLTRALGKLTRPLPAWIAQRALFELKCLLEAGELPTLHHNPAAR
jgi:uncharacterized membrane protein